MKQNRSCLFSKGDRFHPSLVGPAADAASPSQVGGKGWTLLNHRFISDRGHRHRHPLLPGALSLGPGAVVSGLGFGIQGSTACRLWAETYSMFNP